MMKPVQRYVVVAGPTASGKSSVAMTLAEKLGGEIVGCDSVQLYRGFDIGSAKPTVEEQRHIPHHLIDVVDWNEDFDARRYEIAATAAIQEIQSRGRLPIVVGGTGLYLRALWGENWHGDLPKDPKLREELAHLDLGELQQRLQKLDPERARQIHPNDRYRLGRAIEIATLTGGPVKSHTTELERRHHAVMILMTPDRAILHQRIATRVQVMLESGFIDEVKGLLQAGCPVTAKPMQSIGYREVAMFLTGQMPQQDLAMAITIATRQYAKRQDTWFRKSNPDFCLAVPEIADAFLEKIKENL